MVKLTDEQVAAMTVEFTDEQDAAIGEALKAAHIDSIISAKMMNVGTISDNGPWPMNARNTITGQLAATTMTFGNIVSIDLATGAITRLPGFTTTDAAALAFWEAVERLAPNRDQQMRIALENAKQEIELQDRGELALLIEEINEALSQTSKPHISYQEFCRMTPGEQAEFVVNKGGKVDD